MAWHFLVGGLVGGWLITFLCFWLVGWWLLACFLLLEYCNWNNGEVFLVGSLLLVCFLACNCFSSYFFPSIFPLQAWSLGWRFCICKVPLQGLHEFVCLLGRLHCAMCSYILSRMGSLYRCWSRDGKDVQCGLLSWKIVCIVFRSIVPACIHNSSEHSMTSRPSSTWSTTSHPSQCVSRGSSVQCVHFRMDRIQDGSMCIVFRMEPYMVSRMESMADVFRMECPPYIVSKISNQWVCSLVSSECQWDVVDMSLDVSHSADQGSCHPLTTATVSIKMECRRLCESPKDSKTQ